MSSSKNWVLKPNGIHTEVYETKTAPDMHLKMEYWLVLNLLVFNLSASDLLVFSGNMTGEIF